MEVAKKIIHNISDAYFSNVKHDSSSTKLSSGFQNISTVSESKDSRRLNFPKSQNEDYFGMILYQFVASIFM